ncbi:MAG: Fic family protein [Verrucomicrobia bacterium]|nr:Fic family protein [Verrucomicrobiota bacterium]
MTISFPEVFVSNALIASQVSKAVKKGLLRRLGSRVYTTNFTEAPEALIRRHAWFIIRELFPDSVIVDRTALEHKPAEDGSVFIVSKKKRPVFLPGLSIYPRKGHGPLEEDRPFMSTLFLSSPARAYLENLCKRRKKVGVISRTLSRKELEEKLELLLQRAGVEALQKVRDEARKIAHDLRLEHEYKILNGIIGTLLGTHKQPMSSPLSIARAQGLPYDSKRLDLFQKLYETLASTDTKERFIQQPGSALPFFEAYFSNFIEGTEFLVEEAAEIIFEGKIPKGRPKDAHDILGTYQIVSDELEMKKCPKTSDELLILLKKRHALLMHGRPEVNPGDFKTTANRAGATTFVEPELVEGTLRKGFEWLQGLNTAFQRAVYMMFLIAEVHPFTDGNGRCARIMMNAELVAVNQARIIIPTIFRDNYLSALKALTHQNRPEALIRSLDFAQHYTSLINWSDFDQAYKILTATHAFEDANTAEINGHRLMLP